MACPRCRIRLSISHSRSQIRIPARRAFHSSPSRQRQQLGAFTYPQEWQTGAYHFNKATQKTFPVAAQHTDRLLNQWLTQQKKRNITDSAAYQLMLKGSIAAQRRKVDRVFLSKSTVKDFGDRVEVNAFLYDGVEALAKQEAKAKAARMGVKADGAEEGGRRRRPTRLRAIGNAGGADGSTEARRFGGVGSSAPRSAIAFRSMGGMGAGSGGARGPVGSSFRHFGAAPPRK